MLTKILAVVILLSGIAIFALPLPLGLGWAMGLVGFALGECLGVMAGVMWYFSDQVPPASRKADAPPVIVDMVPQP